MATLRSPFLLCSKAVGVEGLKWRYLRDRVNTPVHPYRKRGKNKKLSMTISSTASGPPSLRQREGVYAQKKEKLSLFNKEGRAKRREISITNRRGEPMCSPKKQTTR